MSQKEQSQLHTPQPGTSAHSHLQGQWLQAGIISLLGATAADFLQGYVTCDTSRLEAGHGLPMAICNLKGRVVASGWLLKNAEGIDILVHTSLVEHVRAFLKPYVTFSKCTFTNDPDKTVAVNSAQASIELAPELKVQVGASAQDVEDCSEAVNAYLIDMGFAFVSEAVSEQFLPQVLNLHNQRAVDFDKGCYLGQEIVARAQFRGAVKRQLISFNDPALPQVGQAWGDGGTVIAIDTRGHGLATAKTG